MAAIQIAQIATWLNREIGKKLEQNSRTARKLVQEGLATIGDMTHAASKIEDYAANELRKGTEQLVRTTRTRSEYKVARHLSDFSGALQVLLERIKVPDSQDPDYNSLRQFHDFSLLFARDAKTLFTKFRVILAAPWIRSRKELKDLRSSVIAFGEKMAELKQFNDEKFSLNREVEVFLRRLSKLRTQHQTLNQTKQKLSTLHKEELTVLERKNELEHQMKVLQKNSRFHEWENIQRIKYELELKIRKLINPLKRTLKKIENQAETVQEFFTDRAMEQIHNYLEDPYNAFVADDDGPTVLIELARGIKESIQTEKLVIDKSRGRKGLEAAERMIQNPNRLHKLLETHMELETSITQFQSAPETAELFKEIARIEAQFEEVDLVLREIARRRKRIKAQMTKDQNVLAEQISEMERLAKKLTGKVLKIIDA